MNHFAFLLLAAATVALASAAPEALSRLKRQDETPGGDMSEMPPSGGDGMSSEEDEAEGREIPSEGDWVLMMQPWGMLGKTPPPGEEMPEDWIDAMVQLLLMDGGMGSGGHPGYGGQRRNPMVPEVAYNFFTLTNNTINIMVPGMVV
ncbi:uncharacterized protein LOC125037604 [Penaeus chinensis]|uniref:uncharacterized protein LOC125037604 n=1 Tax=Penaeus chinensis TaxID=139456 RepID=UPI001FB7E956|nr:uncharacterized protein LOC125037604 [Penaeus chinensis]